MGLFFLRHLLYSNYGSLLRFHMIRKHYLFGMCGTLFAGLCYTSMGTLVKIITNSQHPPSFSMILFFESLVAWLIIVATHANNLKELTQTKRPLLHALRATAGLSMVITGWVSIKYLRVANAVLLHNTAPLFIPIIGFIFWRKRVRAILWLPILLGLAGIFLVDNPDKGLISLPAALALASGLCFAFVLTLSKMLSKTEPIPRILFYYFLYSTLVTGCFLGWNWQPTSTINFIYMIALGPMFWLIQTSLNFGIRHASALSNSILFYSCVVFGFLADWWLWHLPPVFEQVCGVVVIISCCIFTIVMEHKNQTPQKGTSVKT